MYNTRYKNAYPHPYTTVLPRNDSATLACDGGEVDLSRPVRGGDRGGDRDGEQSDDASLMLGRICAVVVVRYLCRVNELFVPKHSALSYMT